MNKLSKILLVIIIFLLISNITTLILYYLRDTNTNHFFRAIKEIHLKDRAIDEAGFIFEPLEDGSYKLIKK